ncbi:MAG: hypothetical protein LBP74_10595 [Treponema sp.]|jgi:hypothetical protein|nr:hypothetical protein [Treponema sp.]
MVSVPELPRYRIGRIRIRLLCAAVVFLLAGVLIYAFFRKSGLLIFHVTGKIPLWENLPRRYAGRPWGNVLCYNVPGGLWLLSGVLCIRTLWLGPGTRGDVYVSLFCALAVLLEALQYVRILPGTFDPADMFVLAATAFGERLWYTHFIYRRI